MIFLCLTILTLFASTTIFSVNYTLFNQSLLLTDYIKSGRALWTASHGADIEYPTDPLRLVKDYSGLTNCGCTAALTVNVSSALRVWLLSTVFFSLGLPLPLQITLGDAIVCWRACTIWGNNRLVKTVSSLLVFATFGKSLQVFRVHTISRHLTRCDSCRAVLGGVSTAKGCRPVFSAEHLASNDVSFNTQFGTVYQGIPSAVVASVLSLSTNLWATLLVGYKAWYAVGSSGIVSVRDADGDSFHWQEVEETPQGISGSRIPNGETVRSTHRIRCGILYPLGEPSVAPSVALVLVYSEG